MKAISYYNGSDISVASVKPKKPSIIFDMMDAELVKKYLEELKEYDKNIMIYNEEFKTRKVILNQREQEFKQDLFAEFSDKRFNDNQYFFLYRKASENSSNYSDIMKSFEELVDLFSEFLDYN